MYKDGIKIICPRQITGCLRESTWHTTNWRQAPKTLSLIHICRKRLEVADDRDGLNGQLGDGTKVEQATDAGVDDAEHDDGAPINTGGDAGGQE